MKKLILLTTIIASVSTTFASVPTFTTADTLVANFKSSASSTDVDEYCKTSAKQDCRNITRYFDGAGTFIPGFKEDIIKGGVTVAKVFFLPNGTGAFYNFAQNNAPFTSTFSSDLILADNQNLEIIFSEFGLYPTVLNPAWFSVSTGAVGGFSNYLHYNDSVALWSDLADIWVKQ